MNKTADIMADTWYAFRDARARWFREGTGAAWRAFEAARAAFLEAWGANRG